MATMLNLQAHRVEISSIKHQLKLKLQKQLGEQSKKKLHLLLLSVLELAQFQADRIKSLTQTFLVFQNSSRKRGIILVEMSLIDQITLFRL